MDKVDKVFEKFLYYLVAQSYKRKWRFFKKYYLVNFQVEDEDGRTGQVNTATCFYSAFSFNKFDIMKGHREQHSQWGMNIVDVNFALRLSRKDYVYIDTALKSGKHNTTGARNEKVSSS